MGFIPKTHFHETLPNLGFMAMDLDMKPTKSENLDPFFWDVNVCECMYADSTFYITTKDLWLSKDSRKIL